MIFSLEKICDNDVHINVLYGLLNSRIHKISHKNIPSLEEHSNFVRNHPYRAWLLVKVLDEEFEPLPELKSMRAAQFSINVAPSNINLIEALEQYGCKCSQISFFLKCSNPTHICR